MKIEKKRGNKQMILVIDVGNTNIVLGVYQGQELIEHWRIATDRTRTTDENGMLVKALFRDAELNVEEVEGIVLSSVVPPVVFPLENMCVRYFKRRPFLIGPGIKTGLDLKVDNPREVGADRIVNAVAATAKYEGPMIIVDFGTATTYCYIDAQKRYYGGIISPGVMVATEALYNKAAKLPRIEIAKPQSAIGRNTIHAMQSGTYFGYVAQVDGLVHRMKDEMGEAKVIATGGLARLISEESTMIEVVDPFLTLDGLRIIYERNK